MRRKNLDAKTLSRAFRWASPANAERLFRSWLVSFKEHPERLVRGLAIGVFCGMLPMLGQGFVAIALAWIFRGNKVAAFSATFVSNPVTTAPIFALDYLVGRLILGKESAELPRVSLAHWAAWLDLGWEFILTMFVGGVAVGLVASVAAFFVGRVVLQRVKMRRSARRVRA